MGKDDELRLLAQAYLDAPDASRDPRVQEMARAEVVRVERAFEALKRKIQIVFVSHDPYSSFEQLRDQVRSERRMLVYTGGSETPLWSPEANWKARAVHDWDHLEHSADFSFEGEAAMARHASAQTPGLSPLYISEIALQAAVQNYTGNFAAQKFVRPTVQVDRVVRSLRGIDAPPPDAEAVWLAAGVLGAIPPMSEQARRTRLMMHLKAHGYTAAQAVVIAYAALGVE